MKYHLLVRTGLLICMNLYSWLFSFLSADLIPGAFGTRQRCTKLSGHCRQCGKMNLWTQGIFCVNFLHSVGLFPPCQGSWCGSCYTSKNDLGFFCQVDDREVHQLVGENTKSNLWRHKAPDDKQFMEARPGDHLLSPFICHL